MAKRLSGTSAERGDGISEIHCTCALIRRSARQITQAYDAALKDTGLRITQYSILANLDRLKSLSITDLADVLVMDRTALTRNAFAAARWTGAAVGRSAGSRASAAL